MTCEDSAIEKVATKKFTRVFSDLLISEESYKRKSIEYVNNNNNNKQNQLIKKSKLMP